MNTTDTIRAEARRRAERIVAAREQTELWQGMSIREQVDALAPSIESGLDEAVIGLEEFGTSKIEFTVNIDENISIQENFAISRTVEVPIKTSIPINEEVDTTITIDGSTWFRGRSAMVLVGNFGTISGGISVLPDADPADGRLDVLVLSTSTVRDWLAVSWRMLRGRSFDGVAAERTQGQSIVVTTDRERRWEIDGEEREPTREVSFDVVADSLSVVEGSNQ